MGASRSLPTTLNQFLTIYNPKKVKKALRAVKDTRGAIAVKTPSLAGIRREYGEEKAEAYIKIWTIELNEVLNVTRPLTEAQIDEFASLLISEFWAVSIADLYLVFKTAKLGGYGELYGSLSIDKMLGWFRKYYDERQNIAASINREKHSKTKYIEEKGERVLDKEIKKMREARQKYELEQLKNRKDEL